MQDLYREGRTRAIGVSNFHADRLVDLIDHNDVVPAVDQIETHPFHQRTADQHLMREHGVQLESWGPSPRAGTTSSPTRSWPPSPRPTTGPSPRSSCAG